MYKTTTFKISGMILLCIIALNSIAFCQMEKHVETFKVNITADDGMSITLKQDVYELTSYFNQKMGKVQLFDESEAKLLGEFDFRRFILSEQTDEYTFELKKVKDYENVTLYDLIIKYTYVGVYHTILPVPEMFGPDEHYYRPKIGDTITYTLKLWIDRGGENEYSGSLTYTPIDLSVSSFEGYEYYKAIEDMLLGMVYDEFNAFNKDFEDEKPHKMYSYLEWKIINWIKAYDPITAQDLERQLTEIKRENLSVEASPQHIKNHTRGLLIWYTSPVSVLEAKKTYFNEMVYGAELEELLKMPNRPDVAGELPVNQKELEAYENWMVMTRLVQMTHEGLKNLYDFMITTGILTKNQEELEAYKSWKIKSLLSDDYALRDGYNNPIRLTLSKEGLTTTSAGKDRTFDTEDDMSFTRTYESIGMVVE